MTAESPDIILPSDDEVKKYAGDESKPAEQEPCAADAPESEAEESGEKKSEIDQDPLAGMTEDQVRSLALEAVKYKEAAQRAVADLANYRKRVMRDRPRTASLTRRDLLVPIVGALDDLGKALDAAQAAAQDPAEAVSALAEGVRLTRDGLIRQLGSFGFKPMNAAGERFDPNRHEAVSAVPRDDVPGGMVVELLQEGYMLDDLIVRSARVVVSQEPEEKENDTE